MDKNEEDAGELEEGEIVDDGDDEDVVVEEEEDVDEEGKVVKKEKQDEKDDWQENKEDKKVSLRPLSEKDCPHGELGTYFDNLGNQLNAV